MARRLLINLSTFLRYSLKKEKEISLREELNYVEAYLSIEQARYKDKLTVSYSIDPQVDLDLPIPPFTIQPLVENAIKHGLKSKVKGGEILINIYNELMYTVISVKDNGIGIKQSSEIEKAKGNGLGLYLVNERLKRIYGNESTIIVESEPEMGTKVFFKIPIRPIQKDVIYSFSN